MSKPVYLFALFVFVVLPAVSQTVIKGHHLGETPEQFLQADSEIRKNLADCHAEEPKPITQDQVRAMSKAEIQALQLDQIYNPSRKQLEEMASKGQLFTKDTRYSEQKAYCEMLVNSLEKGSPIPFFGEILFPDVKLPRTLWFFGGGHLLEIVGTFRAQTSPMSNPILPNVSARHRQNHILPYSTAMERRGTIRSPHGSPLSYTANCSMTRIRPTRS